MKNYFDMFRIVQRRRTYFHKLGDKLLGFGSFEKTIPEK